MGATMDEQKQPLLIRTRRFFDFELSENQKLALILVTIASAIIIFLVCWVAFLTWLTQPPLPPTFEVESVSVLFHKPDNSSDDDATIRAEWSIRLSAKAGKAYNEFGYNDLHVLFRLATSPDWSRTVLVHSSGDQHPKDMTSLNATVETLLPRSDVDHVGATLEFEVMFVVQYVDRVWIKAACNHMMVGISPDAKEGIMEGGPRWCPYRHYW